MLEKLEFKREINQRLALNYKPLRKVVVISSISHKKTGKGLGPMRTTLGFLHPVFDSMHAGNKTGGWLNASIYGAGIHLRIISLTVKMKTNGSDYTDQCATSIMKKRLSVDCM